MAASASRQSRLAACATLVAFATLFVATPSAAAVGKGDARNGERVYSRCLACHTLEHDVVGPRHCGLFGRRAGTVVGFDYSPAMKRSNIVWNETSLDKFLLDPMKALPGTSMTYAGVPDPQERADLIAWLKQATDGEACRSAPAAARRLHSP
jgi:cytochrome c